MFITRRTAESLVPFPSFSALSHEKREHEQLKPYVHVSTKLSGQDRRDAQLLVPILSGIKIKQWRRNAEAALIENNSKVEQQSGAQNQA